MNVTLKPGLKKFVTSQIKTGRYDSVEDVFSAAIARLMQDEQAVDFAPGELLALVEEGEADIQRGDVLTLEEVRLHFQKKAAAAMKSKAGTKRRRR